MTGGAAGGRAVTLPPRDEPTTTGLPPRAAAMLAYSAWWLTGALFLVIEPGHPFVRFHARQALVGLGAAWALGFALWTLSFLAVFVSSSAFLILAMLAQAVWGAGILLWVVCLVKAGRGERWVIPGLGRLGSSRGGPGPPD